MKLLLSDGLIAALMLCAVPVWAQSTIAVGSTTSVTSMKVVDSLTISTLNPMSIGRPATRMAESFRPPISASTVVSIGGGPNQAYSIRFSRVVPVRGSATMEDLTAWSDNVGGNITAGRSVRMDSKGRDVLRLNGRLCLPGHSVTSEITASLTLGIDYQ